jgi:hypothetical protein
LPEIFFGQFFIELSAFSCAEKIKGACPFFDDDFCKRGVKPSGIETRKNKEKKGETQFVNRPRPG